MMLIKAYGDDTLYVVFPLSSASGAPTVPPKVAKWLAEHKIDDWVEFNENKLGVFLFGEDAIAFRLKFSL